MSEEEVKVKGKGISTYIKSRFLDLAVDQALPFEEIVQDVRKQFPHVKDNTSASARVNLVLKQKKVSRDFKKIRNSKDPTDKTIYIVRKTETEQQLDAATADLPETE